MAEESGLVVGRRGRAEIARLAGLYRASGMGRSEFCRRHGLALGTLSRYLKRQPQPQQVRSEDPASRVPLVEPELATAVVPVSTIGQSGALTVVLANGRRVEVGDRFTDETLRRLIAVLERW